MPPKGRSDPGFGAGHARYPGSFLLAFREALAAQNWQVRQWKGAVVECLDEQGRPQVVGLENLFRRARRVSREEWPGLVSEFLRTVSQTELGEGLPENLAAVAGQLLPRLGKPLQLAPPDARVWSQPLGETGLSISLVIDYPNRMFYVTEKLVEDSGRPGSDWVEQSLTNLRGRTPEGCFQNVHEESGMLLCSVGDAYDSSRALLLPSLLPSPENAGHFLAIPSRDELVVSPVTPQALAHVHLMKLLAEKNFQSAPYAISNEVYWLHDGVWRVFAIAIKGEAVTVQPPEAFVEVLNRWEVEGRLRTEQQPPD